MTGWLLAAAVAGAMDTGTSCVAFSRGFREANPILPSSCLGLVVVKAPTTAISLAVLERVSRRHPVMARWGALAVMGVSAGAALHNWRAVRRS